MWAALSVWHSCSVCTHLEALSRQPLPGKKEKSWSQGGRLHGALPSVAGLQEMIGCYTGTAQNPAFLLRSKGIPRVRPRDFNY